MKLIPTLLLIIMAASTATAFAGNEKPITAAAQIAMLSDTFKHEAAVTGALNTYEKLFHRIAVAQDNAPEINQPSYGRFGGSFAGLSGAGSYGGAFYGPTQ